MPPRSPKSPKRERPSSPSVAKMKLPTDAEERNKYVGLYGTRFAKASAWALALYLFSTSFPYGPVPEYGAVVKTKLLTLHAQDLGWVYLAWIFVWAARCYATFNANGARGPTGLGRPDQHIYSGGARMVTEGDEGSFNRAQRAAFNLDETIGLFASGLLLVGYVFGPAALVLAMQYFYGAKVFCDTYKAGGNRGAGFRPRVNAEWTCASLVLLCAAKALLGPRLPY
jgi:hypothetical protein